MTPVVEVKHIYTVDDKEREFVGSIKKWIDSARACVHSQRPTGCVEGPQLSSAKVSIRQTGTPTPEQTLESAKHDLNKLVGLDSVKLGGQSIDELFGDPTRTTKARAPRIGTDVALRLSWKPRDRQDYLYAYS